MLIYKAPIGGKIETLNSIPDVDYSHATHRGNNVIHLAAKLGHKMFVLEARCSGYPYLKSKKNLKGDTPLHVAARAGGRTPLLETASSGDVSVLKEILRQYPNTIELCDLAGKNALHLAMLNNTELNVKAFLSLPQIRELVNEPDNEGNTPLHLATMNHNYKLVKKLIPTKGVDLRAKNQNEKTALGIYSLSVCCSLTVVFLLILATAGDPAFLHKAIIYSKKLLKYRPWRSVVAFITGLDTVISPKSQWATTNNPVICYKTGEISEYSTPRSVLCMLVHPTVT
ncbi:hypothetical protein Patl1_04330 [Pistacia atlantica]|uniref:Uncharacterized protein n=1 Tax=Pistacia atlantica TaxID=434234 RepID=A0ACC1BQN6_9ROSI|nr:hypothetical protein Patl1_04330 [Pistacia atlantica]